MSLLIVFVNKFEQPVRRAFEHRRIERVPDELSVPFALHQLARLRDIARMLARNLPQGCMTELSMGMTQDFEVVGNARLADLERIRDFSGSQVPGLQHVEYGAPGWVVECFEKAIHLDI